MKKIVAINAGPRKGWNTDQMVRAAANGAAQAGAEITYIDLYKLPRFTGCISCFGCKTEQSFGKCACRDGLSDVLEAIRNADGLIVGSPNYLSNMTAGFRALFERLVFQSLTYNKEKPNCNTHLIPVLMITTSNCAEEMYEAIGYTQMLESYKQSLSSFVGPTEVLVCGDTLQVEDYGKYDWTMFDPKAKKEHHDATFRSYLDKAYAQGKALTERNDPAQG